MGGKRRRDIKKLKLISLYTYQEIKKITLLSRYNDTVSSINRDSDNSFFFNKRLTTAKKANNGSRK